MEPTQTPEPATELTPAQEWDRQATVIAIDLLKPVLAEEQKLISNSQLNGIRDFLLSKTNDSRKQRLARCFMLPTVVAAQVHAQYNFNKGSYWKDMTWAPLIFTFQLFTTYVKEETRRIVVRLMNDYPTLRAIIEREATLLGVNMKLTSDFLDRMLSATEKAFRS